MATPQPTRRPYTGSCHCGAINYIIYLTMPHTPPEPYNLLSPDGKRRQLFYRCNCTTCTKTSLLHVRVPSPPDDFLLLSPLDPLRGSDAISDYQCFEKKLHFLFCKTCGVRCFMYAAPDEGRVVEREVRGEKKMVWTPSEGDWVEKYLSVNASTIDGGQKGLDLKEWTEKGWVMYLEGLMDHGEERWPRRYGEPYDGGVY